MYFTKCISRSRFHLKMCQKVFLNHQKHFRGYFDHFHGVFGQFGVIFGSKTRVFPISAKNILDGFGVFLGISRPNIRLKTRQKMCSNLKSTSLLRSSSREEIFSRGAAVPSDLVVCIDQEPHENVDECQRNPP